MNNIKLSAVLAKPGYIFDLDGVLVDTAVFHFKAWKRLANGLGFDFTENQNEQLKGVSRVESLNKILAWGGIVKTEEEKRYLAEKKNAWYLEMVHQMTDEDVLTGVLAFLTKAKDQGKKIALGSASKNAPLILDKTGIGDFFDAVIDGNKVSASKPDPEVFLLAAQELGLAVRDCLVFEDAQAGIDAALAGDMQAIGIGSADDLKGAVTVVAGLHELSLD